MPKSRPKRRNSYRKNSKKKNQSIINNTDKEVVEAIREELAANAPTRPDPENKAQRRNQRRNQKDADINRVAKTIMSQHPPRTVPMDRHCQDRVEAGDPRDLFGANIDQRKRNSSAIDGCAETPSKRLRVDETSCDPLSESTTTSDASSVATTPDASSVSTSSPTRPRTSTIVQIDDVNAVLAIQPNDEPAIIIQRRVSDISQIVQEIQVAWKRMEEDNESTLKLKEEEYASAFDTAKDNYLSDLQAKDDQLKSAKEQHQRELELAKDTYQSDLKAKDDQLKSSQSDLQAKDEQLKSAKEQHQRELEVANQENEYLRQILSRESDSLRQISARMSAAGNESDEIVRGPQP
jgi:hypothetical protein